MKRRALGAFGVFMAGAMLLAGCGKSSSTSSNSGAKDAKKFPEQTDLQSDLRKMSEAGTRIMTMRLPGLPPSVLSEVVSSI